MIDGLLKDKGLAVSDLDAIAFGRGPGSFMGLRIAAGVVQGIAFSHDIPVIPISTLKVIALCAYELTQNKNVLVAIDARMDEVYWAAYYLSAGQWLLDGEEKVISPDKIQLPEMLINKDKTWVGAGTGWGNYADRLLADTGFKLQTMLPDFRWLMPPLRSPTKPPASCTNSTPAAISHSLRPNSQNPSYRPAAT